MLPLREWLVRRLTRIRFDADNIRDVLDLTDDAMEAELLRRLPQTWQEWREEVADA